MQVFGGNAFYKDWKGPDMRACLLSLEIVWMTSWLEWSEQMLYNTLLTVVISEMAFWDFYIFIDIHTTLSIYYIYNQKMYDPNY